MAKDIQSESSKLDQENARKDAKMKAEYEAYQRSQKAEAEENAGPRKAVGEAVDYVKNKASDFASDLGKGARNYGRLYKEGLGMKPDTAYEKKKGGVIKSASSRADGCAIRGKTRGKMY